MQYTENNAAAESCSPNNKQQCPNMKNGNKHAENKFALCYPESIVSCNLK